MNVTFLTPEAMLFLALVPMCAALFVWRGRQRADAMHRLGEADLLVQLTPGMSQSRRKAKAGLWLLALGALIVALARPVWGVEVDVIETQGVAAMLVLDVSNSMLAQDLLPNRLERARLAVRDLAWELSGNEIGLILFAGQAVIQFPLTTDTASIQPFISAAGPDAITQQGTNLDEALRLAMASLDQPRPSARIIVVMTDGEGHQGDPLEAAELAAQAGITIHAIGYGTPGGAPVPLVDAGGRITGYRAEADGNLVLSRLDEQTLRAVVDRTGGVYQRAGMQNSDTEAIISQINQAEAGTLTSRTAARGVERFGVFLLLAALALGMEMTLSEARKVMP